MSELRSTYPQAKAWTFLIDTPPSAATSSSGHGWGTAAGAGGLRKGATAAAAEAQKKKGSLGSSTGGGSSISRGIRTDGESMGGICSSTKNVANKENVGDGEQEQTAALAMAPPGALPADAAVDASRAYMIEAPKHASGGASVVEEGREEEYGNGGGPEIAMLDSTAFLSPSPDDVRAHLGDGAGGAVGDMCFDDEQRNAEDGGDRAAWLVRNLGLLRSGSSVDVAQLKQLPGVEDCLHELISGRERHLKAMENLTIQLRRREVDAEKAARDAKELTVRLECAEQDKASLGHRMRALGEEHRVNGARWFVHKQELETRCTQLEGRDTQYRAAIRKKETEYGRLQDAMRRAVQKDSRVGVFGGGNGAKSGKRGVEANFELSPGEATTEDGGQPLGGLMNEQARRRGEELEKENFSLRSMLVDLQADVVDLRGYHDRHGDLVSAGRVADDGIWGDDGDMGPLPEEVIEGMPADWLQRRLGEETARQITGMRGALARVLGDASDDAVDRPAMSESEIADIVSGLREARSLLREQDAIMLAAIFDRPGAETDIGINKQRCMCGKDVCGVGGGGGEGGGSGTWDTMERLEQDREELNRERARLEKDKARFLEEAVQRDSKSFVFSCPMGTPGSPNTPCIPGSGDAAFTTPGHFHRHLAATGTLMVPLSPCPNTRDVGGLSLMTFTPPTASPDTARLLGEIGIQPNKSERVG